MKAVILQHVPFEGPGSIADWLTTKSAEVRTVRLHEGDVLPEAKEVDLVIVLGGPMSVNDVWFHDWIGEEKRFLAECIAQGRAVVGICLGAQLIASALGASVGPNEHAEIGWFDVTAAPARDTFTFPQRITVMHWHGETFSLPSGAELLASSEACRNQAFQYGKRVIALQFHLETTSESLDALLEACGDELLVERFVQSEQAILDALPRHAAGNQALMAAILDHVTKGLT